MTNIDFPVIYLENHTERVFGYQPPNTGELIGCGASWLKQIGEDQLVSIFRAEMIEGNYVEALQTFDKWFDTYLIGEYEAWLEDRAYQ